MSADPKASRAVPVDKTMADHLRQLRSDARHECDGELLDLCDEALAGDAAAIARCLEISAARTVEEEALVQAHDHVAPDRVYDAIGAVNLYVAAFKAGMRFANERAADERSKTRCASAPTTSSGS
jgi:hypothetical protein